MAKKLSNNLVIADRRKKVIKLIFKGVSQRQIAEDLGVNTSTIENDLRVSRVKLRKEHFDDITKEDIYALLTERMNERLIRYWKIIQTTIDNREIIVALNSLREEDKDLVKRAQIVGLLPRNLLEGANLINAPNSEVNITQEDKRVINIIWGEKPDDKT